MLEVTTRVTRARRAACGTSMVCAMLISGCFSAGPSVKQAMTSAAPGVVPTDTIVASAVHQKAPMAAASDGVGAAKQEKPASFDLDKPEVRRSVATFQTELRDFFHGALLRSGKYVPTMTSMLIHEGLPAELAYLPLIESGYRPEAVSPAGAVGPWQFIPETGKRYGLRIDSLVDERRDPIKSTEAAVQYLKELHEMFGDWELSLAAYNSGEWRVARIIADTGAPDFWSMRNRGYLPSETSQYVPRFLAAVRIARAPQDYGFIAPAGTPFQFETVDVDRELSLRTAAGLCGVSASELAELNPALRRGITPSGYALRVPAGAAEPLRAALAAHTEPARASTRVARAARAGSRGTAIAKAAGRRHVVTRAAAPTRTARGCRQPARRSSTQQAAAPTLPARRAERPSRGKAGLVRVAREVSPFLSVKPSKSAPRSRRRAG